VTVQQIEEYLDRFGWRLHESHQEETELEGYVVTAWIASDETRYHLMIDPMIEKGMLAFRAQRVHYVKPSVTPSHRLLDALLYLAFENYRTARGTWGVDPNDGEVVLKVMHPLDEDLPYERFRDILQYVIGEVEYVAGRLRDIASGARTAKEVLGELDAQIG
jgi:hypothetical protein